MEAGEIVYLNPGEKLEFVKEQCCKKCRFYKLEQLSEGAEIGKCRFNPPVIMTYLSKQPEVYSSDWCGQFDAVPYPSHLPPPFSTEQGQ